MNFTKSKKEQKGNEYQKYKQYKNSHIPKIQMSDPDICLPFCYWELTWGHTDLAGSLPPCSYCVQPWDPFSQAYFPGWGNKRWFRFPFRSCFLPGGMLSGGTGRGRRSPLRWGNGLDLSQQASLSPLPRGLSGCNGEVRGLVSSLQFFLCHLLMSIVISQHPDTRTPLRPCSNHNLSQITQALQTSLA